MLFRPILANLGWVVGNGRVVVATVLLAIAGACTGGPAPGTEGWACPNDNNCQLGLICTDGRCTPGARDAGRPVLDAGVPDVGVPDAGPRDVGPVDAGPPDAGCPTPPRLSQIRAQIFGATGRPACNQAICHGANAAGGIRLDTPLAELHTALFGPTLAVGAPEANLVVAGDPVASRLFTIVNELDPEGNGGPMPPAAPLDACSIDSIRQWIEAGALQN